MEKKGYMDLYHNRNLRFSSISSIPFRNLLAFLRDFPSTDNFLKWLKLEHWRNYPMKVKGSTLNINRSK